MNCASEASDAFGVFARQAAQVLLPETHDGLVHVQIRGEDGTTVVAAFTRDDAMTFGDRVIERAERTRGGAAPIYNDRED